VAVRIALFGPAYYLIEQGIKRARGGGSMSSGGGGGGGGGGGANSYPGGLGASYGSYAANLAAATSHRDLQAQNFTGSSGGLGTSTGFGEPTTQVWDPEVKVYIGDVELRDIVKTEIVYNEDGQVARLVAGRRT
jgi:hypothetical protein